MNIKKILAPFTGWELFVLSLCFLVAETSASAQVLPASPLPLSRTPGGSGSWSGYVGVPGGIPYRTNIYTTIAAGASVSTVQTAINNCPSNSVVYLSAGTYNWSSSLNLKSGVTLRGAGPGQTIINCSVNNAIQMVGYECMIFYSDATSPTVTRVNWTGGYTQGTNVITLSSTSGLSVGKNIWFDQLNDQDTEPAGSDPNVIATGTYSTPAYPRTGQDRYQFQMNMVTAINGNNVTLSQPVYMPNWTNTLSPQAWWESSGTPMVWVGVEDMTINDTDSGGNDTGIWGCGLYACWFRNLDFHYYRYSTAIDASLRCEIRHCSISGPEIAGGTDVYGFYPKCGFGNLYVDNIANFSGSAFLIQSCACCVFAYNYTTNCQLRANFNLGPVYLAHGGNPNMLLFEGNWGPAFGMDNTWGSGAYCTALRNRFTGTSDSALAPSGNIEAIDISITNRHMSVIGNVLGTTGYNTIYQETPTNCTDSPRVYWLGGSDNCGGPDDPVVRSTLLRAYNWTSATSTNGGIVLDGYTAGQIPNSLYLPNTSKPSWFGNLAWPPVDPANPAYSMSRTNIPAGYRFVYGVDPAPASGNQSPVAVASASPLTGVAPLVVVFSSVGSLDPEGAALTYNWNFGDGTASTNAYTSHTYATSGTYNARLTVSDGTNNTTSSALTITVNAAPVNQPPNAVASATPASGAAPLNVTFSSAGSTDPEGASLSYNWDFGDGTTSSAANPSHNYSAAGNYLVQLSVSDGMNTTTVSNVTVTVTGLVAAYGFEETNGTAVVNAVTGTSDGTITNATRVPGMFGTALYFNGTDSVVAINNAMASDISSNMTIEAWVKPATAGNNWRPIIGKSYKGSQFSYVIQGATPQGVPSLYIAPASNNLLASTPLPANIWSHVAATYDGTTVRLYVNGVLSASQPQSGAPMPSSDPLTIGSDGMLQSFWNGAIDEVRIYNRALSASEIQTDMNTAIVTPAPLPPPQNLRVLSP
jgi:PKD repeat protein